MQGRKTHEQQLRILEHKDDLPKEGDAATLTPPEPGRAPHDREVRQSEFAVSERGMHQESQHNKHNDPGQEGHKPQKHTAAEEGQ